MNEVILNYFKQLYNGSKMPLYGKNGGIFDFKIDARRGLEWWAMKKAAGIDEIPGEFYKYTKIKDILIERLQKHFTEYTRNMPIPDYFMKARLILISKDGTEHKKLTKFVQSLFYQQSQKYSNSLFCTFESKQPVTKVLK